MSLTKIHRARAVLGRHYQTSLKTIGLVAVAMVGAFITWAVVVNVPSVESFQNRRVAESTKIFDRTGNILLYDVHGAMRRTAVPLSDISPFIRNATVAIEDDTFYQHKGIRPLSIARAVWANLTSGDLLSGQGGSTITQQVVKNTLLTQDKTLIRKMKEWVLALKLEKVATKDRILEIYLNETSYGGTIYGIEEASQYFFGKSARDVTLAEAAYLAALPQAPTRYSPHGNHKDLLDARKNLVLERMVSVGMINDEEKTTAQQESVTFRDSAESGIKAPHFVFYVREYLEEKYGADAVSNGGLRVITTLDYDLQKKAEEIVTRKALENEKKFNAENAGLVAIDPKTGQVLAMVGSRGYFDENIDGKVNVATAKRQPGSSFKPFVYAAAFEMGYTPETVLFDLKTQFTTHCRVDDLETHDDCYSPGNYDDVFRGPMTLRDALAQSINVVAVKALYLVGLDRALDMAQRMGITTLGEKGRYGLTLVLGGGEVTLVEMVGAYAGYGNEGILHPVQGILSVTDAAGTALENYEDRGARVVSAEVARTLSDVLSDNTARTPAFGTNSALVVPGHDVAAKTGTTNDYRDTWIVGYTPGIAAGAWAGNNDNSPMEKRVAGFIVAPLWNEFMHYAVTKYPSDGFTPPSPEPSPETLPVVLRGNWNTDASQGVHEILHWINKNNPRQAGSSRGDAQYPYWEYPVQQWLNPASSTPTYSGGGTDFALASPAPGEHISSNASIIASVEYLTTLDIQRVSYYLNGSSAGIITSPPFGTSITVSQKGLSTLTAVAEGSFGVRESSVSFIVE